MLTLLKLLYCSTKNIRSTKFFFKLSYKIAVSRRSGWMEYEDLFHTFIIQITIASFNLISCHFLLVPQSNFPLIFINQKRQLYELHSSVCYLPKFTYNRSTIPAKVNLFIYVDRNVNLFNVKKKKRKNELLKLTIPEGCERHICSFVWIICSMHSINKTQTTSMIFRTDRKTKKKYYVMGCGW